MIDVIGLKRLGAYRLEIAFSDGSVGIRDFADMASRNGEMVRPLKNPDYFARVFIEDGALTWPNGYDIDPIELHREMKVAGQLRRTDAGEEQGPLHLHLERGDEGLLRDLDLAELTHALLALLLLVEQFSLARHVAAVTFRGDVFSQ